MNMEAKTTAAATAPKNGTKPAAEAGFANFDTLKGDEIFTDRPIYKPESCGKQAIVGYLVERQTLAAPKGRKDAKPWDAYVILLTHPTLCADREDNVVTIPAGREVYLPANVKLDVLNKLAFNPEIMAEVAVIPGDKVDIGGGQTMWTFRQKVLGTKKREGAYLLAVAGSVPVITTDGASS
jgi:hypothetical protein